MLEQLAVLPSSRGQRFLSVLYSTDKLRFYHTIYNGALVLSTMNRAVDQLMIHQLQGPDQTANQQPGARDFQAFRGQLPCYIP